MATRKIYQITGPLEYVIEVGETASRGRVWTGLAGHEEAMSFPPDQAIEVAQAMIAVANQIKKTQKEEE